ncbi:MAG: Holliday junction branch migration protein RuvA [Candidatus Berkelbacteria bacterium]
MIAYLKGKIVLASQGRLIIDVSGVGYKVMVASQKSQEIGSETELFIHEHIREDADDFYGFEKYEELELFERLISVNGVGPKAGLLIMAAGSVAEIVSSIQLGNIAFFKSITGIGNKVAAKIILELKDKVANISDAELIGNFDQEDDVVEGLISLGYKKAELTKIIAKIPADLTESEDKIRWCLRNLSNN